MVSPLWNASSDGDLTQVQLLLKEASPIDIEIKDANGATPLVQAVKNGHVEVVRALLDAGADVSGTSNEESLEQLTTDATILELLNTAKEKRAQPEQNTLNSYHPEDYPQEYLNDPSKSYYEQPHGSYMYYPPIHPGAAMLPDGASAPYYGAPPLPPSGQPSTDSNGGSNLPPPEIARLIPCRYFPACRYGPSCIFAHPQGPYFQGPLPPPAQYPTPYDPMAPAPYTNGYYGVPQQSYGPNGLPPTSINPLSPPLVSAQPPTPQQNHVQVGPEVVSPMQAPFAPPNGPQPVPYALPVPGGYPPSGPLPPIPVGMPPLPPPQQQMPSAPPTNNAFYQPTSPVIQPQPHRRSSSVAHPQNGIPTSIIPSDGLMNQGQHMSAQQDGFQAGMRPQHRDNLHGRRGSVRRLSTMGPSRKPPCLFFPSGRCRNGDSCRFPHILPDNTDHASMNYPAKPGLRSRPSPPVAEGLEEKMNGMSIRPDNHSDVSQPNGHPIPLIQPNGSRSIAQYKTNYVNGIRSEKRNGVARHGQVQQRIPSADDFPVLAGAATPPARSPGYSPLNGPTAAQVLQAPPPVRKDSSKSSTHSHSSKGTDTPVERTSSPQSTLDQKSVDEMKNNARVNDINGSAMDIKPPTFASIAGPPASELANAVSVSA